jgi:hypothetical protein
LISANIEHFTTIKDNMQRTSVTFDISYSGISRWIDLSNWGSAEASQEGVGWGAK